MFGRRASQRRASISKDTLVKRHANGPDPWDDGRRRCVLAAALAFVLCGAVPAPRETPPPPPKKEFPWVPVAVAGAGAIALARPEVRAGRALASLGRGVVIGAFPA